VESRVVDTLALKRSSPCPNQWRQLLIGYGLLPCVQIHAYNSHLGLLRSEQSVVRAPTVYSAPCEADFVMPSDGTFSLPQKILDK
jgi:hypothetical protein